MFCYKCGTELKKGTRFCTSCGAGQEVSARNSDGSLEQASAQHSGFPFTYGNPKAVSAKWPARVKKALIPITAAVLVVALTITGIATSGFGLIQGSKSKNPVAVTWDALKSVFTMESFEFETRIKTPYFAVRTDGYIVSGDSIQGAVAYGSLDTGYDNYKFGAYNGDFFVIDDYYDETYVYSYDYAKDSLTYDAGIDIDESLLYKENGLNFDGIVVQTGKLFLDTLFNYYSYYYSSVKGGRDFLPDSIRPTMEDLDEAYAIIEDFIYSTLEDEAILDSIVDIENISKSNGNKKDSLTTYEYSVDPQRLVRELYNYLIEESENHPELKKKIDDIIEEFDDDYSFNSALKMVRDGILSELAYYELEISAEITVDKSGNMREMNISVAIDDEKISLMLTISNINSVSPDIDELKEIINNADNYYTE